MDRGKTIEMQIGHPGSAVGRPPMIERRPEIIHGLRNLIQNAVDFAETIVWVDAEWTEQQIMIRIVDDGHGFPPQVIGRIGDPFVRLRRTDGRQKRRPGYRGMGLGLFIAKTLLERSGAELSFDNAREAVEGQPRVGTRTGAIVELLWPRLRVASEAAREGQGLGENKPITG